MTRGKYAWVFGDDDVIAPGALRKILSLLEASCYDLIFLAPYHFPGESDRFLPSRPLRRACSTVTSAASDFALAGTAQ